MTNLKEIDILKYLMESEDDEAVAVEPEEDCEPDHVTYNSDHPSEEDAEDSDPVQRLLSQEILVSPALAGNRDIPPKKKRKSVQRRKQSSVQKRKRISERANASSLSRNNR